MSAARIIRALVCVLLAAAGTAGTTGAVVLAMDLGPSAILDRILGTCAVVSANAAIGIGAAVLARGGRLVPYAWSALATCMISAAALSAALWIDMSGSTRDLLVKLGPACSAWSLMIVYTGAFLARPAHTPLLRGLRATVIVVTWAFVVMVALLLRYGALVARVLDDDAAMLALAWLIGITGFVGLLGSLVVRVLLTIADARRKASLETLGNRIRIDLHCPRCRAAMNVRTGPVRCDQCRLVMIIAVDEPRCECGYPLYHLAADHCPECGRLLRGLQR